MTPSARRWRVFQAAHLLLVSLVVMVPHGVLERGGVEVFGVTLRWHYLFLPPLSLVLFVCAVWERRPPDFRRDGWPAGLAVFWFLQALLSPFRFFCLKVTAGFLFKGLLPGWSAGVMARSRERVLWLARSMVLVGAAAACLSLLMPLTGLRYFDLSYAAGDRLAGPVGHSLPFATLLLSLLPLCAVCFSTTPAFLACGTALLVSLWAAMSRAALAVSAPVLLALALMGSRIFKRVFFLVGASLMMIAIIFLAGARRSGRGPAVDAAPTPAQKWVGGVQQRVEGTLNPTSEPYVHRLASYGISWRMFKDAPWGRGLGSFLRRYERYRTRNAAARIDSPDNIYLRLLCDTGWAGLAAWILFLLFAFRRGFRLWRAGPPGDLLRPALLLSAASALPMGLFFDYLFWDVILVPWSTVLALAASPWDDASPAAPVPL